MNMNNDHRRRNSTVALVWWSLWIERNDKILKKKAKSATATFNCISELASEWAMAGRSLCQTAGSQTKRA
jgi:hypothetical protein